MKQVFVENDHCSHRFNDGNCTRHHARIVATTGFKRGLFAFYIDCRLRLQKRSYGFERNSEIDVFAIAYASLDATAAIGLQSEGILDFLAIIALCNRSKKVVLLAAPTFRTGKAKAVLKTFSSIDAKHGIAQTGM